MFGIRRLRNGMVQFDTEISDTSDIQNSNATTLYYIASTQAKSLVLGKNVFDTFSAKSFSRRPEMRIFTKCGQQIQASRQVDDLAEFIRVRLKF